MQMFRFIRSISYKTYLIDHKHKRICHVVPNQGDGDRIFYFDRYRNGTTIVSRLVSVLVMRAQKLVSKRRESV